MPSQRKLKVYRTPIGFHDAYVAAPSQKAALEAWGSDANLFARGVAEIVTDPDLTAEPLSKPGAVIKRFRESPADLDEKPAMPKSNRDWEKRRAAPKRSAAAPKRPAKPKPRPDRSALDEAEQAIADAEGRHDAERRALSAREAALRRDRQALERHQAAEAQRLEKARDRTETAYRRAVERWKEN